MANRRAPAGAVLEAALPRGDNGHSNLRGAAAVIVAGEFPHLQGVARRDRIDLWRKYLLRWVGGKNRASPVDTISYKNAELLSRYFPVMPADLIRPELTEEERRLRRAANLEAQARRLRDGA